MRKLARVDTAKRGSDRKSGVTATPPRSIFDLTPAAAGSEGA